jgi:hypothetical protein
MPVWSLNGRTSHSYVGTFWRPPSGNFGGDQFYDLGLPYQSVHMFASWPTPLSDRLDMALGPRRLCELRHTQAKKIYGEFGQLVGHSDNVGRAFRFDIGHPVPIELCRPFRLMTAGAAERPLVGFDLSIGVPGPFGWAKGAEGRDASSGPVWGHEDTVAELMLTDGTGLTTAGRDRRRSD